MAHFRTKNPIWVNFGGSCDGRCWSIIWQLGLLFGYFVAVWYILWLFYIFSPRFGMLHQEKSGNPGAASRKKMPEMQTILSCVCTEIAMK
jgi:hypothetical protein